ncbi:alkaline phosphatase isoform X1 [Patella vulgata]|uniref:alkaline phosphatase isoform X1 n=2 Tax=Patella vulgata TaxID=6465 RepID=UPI0021808F67|nr:alkaline phosphatase isoform X1 [Patella vulgata]XP_050414006.1 alkaline phosphatase isoform X1 [Patella vulgata]
MIFEKMTMCYLLLLIHVIHSIQADDGSKWNTEAQKELVASISLKHNTNVARNVILFLGDGMGISTVSAARLYKAQLTNAVEGTSTLSFENFPYVALSKTYNVDRQTPDSAGTATAFLCGIKANAGTVGVNSNVPRTDCLKEKGNKVDSILDWSKSEGKSVGVVTTSRVTHATPAASYAHTAERNWENDGNMDGVQGGCSDIAKQLLIDNSFIQVVMGGGRSNFIPTSDGGYRKDNQNLIQAWKTAQMKNGRNGTYVTSKTLLDTVDTIKTDNLLGLFADSHMDYSIDRQISNNSNDQPSLAEMTKVAIEILKKSSKGFFLLVEGARIDHGHHTNQARRALHDTVAFDEAIRTAIDNVNNEETLIVVTADHSHVFAMAGYPQTGNDILGFVHPVAKDYGPTDGLPYTALIYGNGPGGDSESEISRLSGLPRKNLTSVDTRNVDFKFPAAVKMPSETHAAEDVGIFATGPMSHLFHGVHNQNYIAHVMAYASCVGSNKKHCDKSRNTGIDINIDNSLIGYLILHYLHQFLININP